MSKLSELIKNKVVLLDGGMGTSLQRMNLQAADYGGEKYLGCSEALLLYSPERVQEVYEGYFAAGSDIILTNTFGATRIVLVEYGLEEKVHEINRIAAALAKQAAEKYATKEKPRFVCGIMGPTSKSLSLTKEINFTQMAQAFEEQTLGLLAGGVDYLLIETQMDTLNLKAVYVGIQAAFSKIARTVPIAISVTMEKTGTMLAGQNIEALYTSVEHMQPLYVGLNCALGPELMTEYAQRLAAISRFPIVLKPNAGMPDAEGKNVTTPDSFSKAMLVSVENGWVNLVGGCCGTTCDYIKRLGQLVAGKKPREVKTEPVSQVSGLQNLVLETAKRPYLVGERANVIGSRIFKNLIMADKFEEAEEVIRKQIKAGAHILDICLTNPDRDEVADMAQLLGRGAKFVKIPFMIDSQNKETIEAAFQLMQGKGILNSVNLENDGKLLAELMPLVKLYGAAVIVGCIEKEMALTAQEKLKIAIKAHKILTETYGLEEENIIFDPLVFPCATGDAKYVGSAKETIEGIRLIKERFPNCKTILGISNVSFGLPPAGRAYMNSVFLYECVNKGLDAAIINVEKLIPENEIKAEEKQLCLDLLYNKGKDPIANFVAHFRDKKIAKKVVDLESLTAEERVKAKICEGSREGLTTDLDELLQNKKPLEIVNTVLMAAMDRVGEKFNQNELIIAEVLQSAEVMRAAITYLEKFMNAGDKIMKGKVLLATVKGDVHDIGKNLVNIILSNNGYEVVDIGIKCEAETILAAVKKHQPDMIGFSGLLVKSGHEMVHTARHLKEAGIKVPILVGGAALSKDFVEHKIQPEYEGRVIYCRDAMNGLGQINAL